VGVLRGALGGTAAFAGRHYRVNWSLAIPERPPAPPIYLAALSRKMLELAGEIADGAVLWLCSPDYVRDVAVPALGRGRARAGQTARGLGARRGRPAGVLGRRPRRSRRLPRRARALSHLAVLPRDARRQRPREGTRRLRSQRRSGRGADPRGRRRRQARGGPGARARVPRGPRGAARNPPDHLP